MRRRYCVEFRSGLNRWLIESYHDSVDDAVPTARELTRLGYVARIVDTQTGHVH